MTLKDDIVSYLHVVGDKEVLKKVYSNNIQIEGCLMRLTNALEARQDSKAVLQSILEYEKVNQRISGINDELIAAKRQCANVLLNFWNQV